MKTLHWYLTRQVMVTLGMTVAVCTFVLLLGNVLKEIIELLLNRQATFGVVVQAVGLLIPWVLVFALPMGMLTATLLVFGRFSADQELTAARANGISLISLATPILLLSLLLSSLCAWINMQLSQQCRIAYKNLIFQTIQAQPLSLLSEGRFLTDFPGYLVYVGKVRGQQLEDILLSMLHQNVITNRLRAAGGWVERDPTNQRMTLIMTNVTLVQYQPDTEAWDNAYAGEMALDIPVAFSGRPEQEKPDYSDMTFVQLRKEKRQLEQYQYLHHPWDHLTPESARKEMKMLASLQGDLVMPVRFQMHRQMAFSFACVGFTLMGIPLGIRAQRRETSVGVAVAVFLVAVYYSFFIAGQALENRPEWTPHLIVWIPNFIFQAVGAVMLWRANRGW